MENNESKKKSIINIVIAILAIIILILIANIFAKVKGYDNIIDMIKKDEKTSSKSENKSVENNLNEYVGEEVDSAEEQNQISIDEIEKMYLEKIKERDDLINSAYKEKLDDYRVDNVAVLSNTEIEGLKENISDYYQDEDILAVVTYSVKPQNIENTSWIAGNGTVSDDWIISKVACVVIRDGQIVSDTTGW